MSTSFLATHVCGYHKHKFSKKEKFFFINNDKIMIIFVIYIAQFIMTVIYNNVQKIAKEILFLVFEYQ